MAKKKIVVYTCITAGYDHILPPRTIDPDIDYICFTDQPANVFVGWTMKQIPPEFGHREIANRYAKMHPHLLFQEYELSIYIDGNIEIIDNLAALAMTALERNDLALYSHPFRDCIYMEANECIAIGHDWSWRIQNQMNFYKSKKYPEKNGLFECNIIFRRHHAGEIISLMNLWWLAYKTGIKRDQLSLPFLVWDSDVLINNLGLSDARFNKKYFSLSVGHRLAIKFKIRIRGYINRKLIKISRT